MELMLALSSECRSGLALSTKSNDRLFLAIVVVRKLRPASREVGVLSLNQRSHGHHLLQVFKEGFEGKTCCAEAQNGPG